MPLNPCISKPLHTKDAMTGKRHSLCPPKAYTPVGENTHINKELQYGMIYNTDKNSTILLKIHTGGSPHPGWGYQGHLSRSDIQLRPGEKAHTGQGIKDKSVPGRNTAFQRLRMRGAGRAHEAEGISVWLE